MEGALPNQPTEQVVSPQETNEIRTDQELDPNIAYFQRRLRVGMVAAAGTFEEVI